MIWHYQNLQPLYVSMSYRGTLMFWRSFEMIKVTYGQLEVKNKILIPQSEVKI